MANTEMECAVSLNPGARFDGLNQIAQLRSQLWGEREDKKEVERFIADMRDITDGHYLDNKRALAAIFYLAEIPASRHEAEFNELTTAEKKSLIKAMNHFKAVVCVFW